MRTNTTQAHEHEKGHPARIAPALARRALRLYPGAWRERYEAEVLDVLAAHTVSYWTVLDVMLGAADAHLRRGLLPGRLTSMTHRIRTSEITIFVAFVFFCVGWLSLRFVRDPLSVWEPATRAHPGLIFALTVLDGAGVISVLAMLAGGLPLVASAILGAVSRRRWNVLLLFAVPVIAIAALVGYAAIAAPYWTQRQSAATTAPLTPLAVVLQFGFLLALVIVIIASTAAVAGAIGRSEVSERALRFALLPGGIATVAMAVGLVAGLVLLALIVSQAPEVGTWPPIEVVLALLLLVAAVLAVVALQRGIAASRS